MDRSLKLKLTAGTVGGLAAVGAGGAIAATQLHSPKAEGQAIVNDAARRLGVKPSALESALKKAAEDRVDAAVAAGRLTKQEGDALKTQIASGDFPPLAEPQVFSRGFGFMGPGPVFGRHFGFMGPGPALAPAATYLGLSASDLRSKLESGKSLAQIARAQGKSVDGLVAALVAEARQHLDEAVSAGQLTKTQETEMLAKLRAGISDFVHGRPHVFKAHLGFPGPPAFDKGELG